MSETIPLTSQDTVQTDTPEFVAGTRKRIKTTLPGIMSNAFGPLREITAAVLTLLGGSEKLSNDTMNMVQSVIAERSMKNSVIPNTPSLSTLTGGSMMAADDPKFKKAA